MCRNIKPLFNFDPPASDDEVEAAALQFIRKVSGYRKPSTVNQEAFDLAVTEASQVVHKLLNALQTQAPKKNREAEKQKAKLRNAKRFG